MSRWSNLNIWWFGYVWVLLCGGRKDSSSLAKKTWQQVVSSLTPIWDKPFTDHRSSQFLNSDGFEADRSTCSWLYLRNSCFVFFFGGAGFDMFVLTSPGKRSTSLMTRLSCTVTGTGKFQVWNLKVYTVYLHVADSKEHINTTVYKICVNMWYFRKFHDLFNGFHALSLFFPCFLFLMISMDIALEHFELRTTPRKTGVLFAWSASLKPSWVTLKLTRKVAV